MAYKFLQLVLVLARCRVAITRLGQHAPELARWHRDVAEWLLSEETHIKLTSRDDKVGEELKYGKARVTSCWTLSDTTSGDDDSATSSEGADR
ncbi:hypothetical protein NDU88_002837 [Pleurodeles waltl]|uniref:Uncharacterized protein n=1 Tax=Pleurodeles waltl TaxID=8319 RepID=A0AAV7KVD5_PLEWA|nr:hypothetical protein NDU88_002837 [Pleurodeles waltl]